MSYNYIYYKNKIEEIMMKLLLMGSILTSFLLLTSVVEANTLGHERSMCLNNCAVEGCTHCSLERDRTRAIQCHKKCADAVKNCKAGCMQRYPESVN
jgi:hypothetical protein